MKENINNEIEKLDIIYGVFNNYYQCDNHRDYKIFLESNQQIKYEFILKGVIKHSYENKIKSKSFSMNDKYIQENLTPPINAWHWGIKNFEILNWSIEKDTEELKQISDNYDNYSFTKIQFEVSTAKIIFIFNDYEFNKM